MTYCTEQRTNLIQFSKSFWAELFLVACTCNTKFTLKLLNYSSVTASFAVCGSSTNNQTTGRVYVAQYCFILHSLTVEYVSPHADELHFVQNSSSYTTLYTLFHAVLLYLSLCEHPLCVVYISL